MSDSETGQVAKPDQIAEPGISNSVMTEYRKHLESLAETTSEAYSRGLARFVQYLSELEEPKHLGQVTRSDVLDYKKSLSKEYSTSTINLYISAVRSFYRWAIENGAPIDDPTRGVRLKSPSKATRRHKREPLTDREVIAVLKTCNRRGRWRVIDARDKAILSLMAYCALRTVEIQRANRGDLETKDGRRVLWVWGKGRSEPDDFVVLPVAAEDALREWLSLSPKSGGPIFISMSPRNFGRRLGLRYLRKMIKARYRRAGIRSPSKTAHSLRHSAITNAIRNNASPLKVQAMARHSDIKTTLAYYHERGRIENPAEDYIDYSESEDKK